MGSCYHNENIKNKETYESNLCETIGDEEEAPANTIKKDEI